MSFEGFDDLSKIIIDEAGLWGVCVEPIDSDLGIFRLTYRGKSIVCRESLCQKTSAISVEFCGSKSLSVKLLRQAGMRTPDQRLAGRDSSSEKFLENHPAVVLKPDIGEQGNLVFANIRSWREYCRIFEEFGPLRPKWILEEYISGYDVRILVIGGKVCAAAVRRPPKIIGDGVSNVDDLIRARNENTVERAVKGSCVPIDFETLRCLRAQGYGIDSVIPADRVVELRNNCNVHTGGSISDMTDELHSDVKHAAVRISEILHTPVMGLDVIMPDLAGAEFTFIEANERPALVNHEPHPVAEAFLHHLYPELRERSR